jgi:hypothetical protein
MTDLMTLRSTHAYLLPIHPSCIHHAIQHSFTYPYRYLKLQHLKKERSNQSEGGKGQKY